MNIVISERGFRFLMHDHYPPNGEESRVCAESSIIGNYDDAFDKPGSSALWIGDEIHLYREEVVQLRDALTCWLETGRLPENITKGE